MSARERLSLLQRIGTQLEGIADTFGQRPADRDLAARVVEAARPILALERKLRGIDREKNPPKGISRPKAGLRPVGVLGTKPKRTLRRTLREHMETLSVAEARLWYLAQDFVRDDEFDDALAAMVIEATIPLMQLREAYWDLDPGLVDKVQREELSALPLEHLDAQLDRRRWRRILAARAIAKRTGVSLIDRVTRDVNAKAVTRWRAERTELDGP